MFSEISNRLLNYQEVLEPVVTLAFSRPLVIIQSDDWGLVGIENQVAFDRIIADYGIRPEYSHLDYYGLETAEDLMALYKVLSSHQDSTGNQPIIGCNFILANVDFYRVMASGFQDLILKPMHDGFPSPWKREGLKEAYREGIKRKYIYPGLHGVTHFCYAALRRFIREKSHRGELIRKLFQIGTPLAYQYSPWVGYEFRDWENGWLSLKEQKDIIDKGVRLFRKTFGPPPITACAPGYRANRHTFRALVQAGIKVIQNGPGVKAPPFIGRHGLLHLHRNVSFEPAIDAEYFTVERAFQDAAQCVKSGQPIIVCIHSVNFHSSLRNFRDLTLERLDQLLTKLEHNFGELIYLSDEDLFDIVRNGALTKNGKLIPLNIEKKMGLSPVLKHLCLQKFSRDHDNA